MPTNEALADLASRMCLPTLPEVVGRINRLIAARCGPPEIGEVVASDPGLSAKVLRLANSSTFGLQEPVVSAMQAATVIGVRALRNIALQASIIQRYEHLLRYDAFDLQDVWRHSALSARLCQTLGTFSRRRTKLAPDEFFTCGLLHDLGKVVLLDSLGEEYLELLQQARRAGLALHYQEERVLGFAHTHVGGLLASRWQLPQPIVDAITYHHGPTERIRADPVVATVAVADQIAYRVHGPTFPDVAQHLEAIAVRVLDVTPDAFARVVEAARSGADEAAGG